MTRQAQQARLADNAMYLFALSAALSDMDRQLRKGASGVAFEKDRAAFEHLFDLLEIRIQQNLGLLRRNADESMRRAAQATLRYVDTLPNRDYYIHEASPVAKGTGKPVQKEHIKQFPGDRYVTAGGDGAPLNRQPPAPKRSGFSGDASMRGRRPQVGGPVCFTYRGGASACQVVKLPVA
ncbi:hypothetical protein [Rhodothermus marinus]|uniref:hypothetical protein n=1 Tax=Rhodothermus marinus TaxID=29549 RepID=UPI001FB30C75|nr:hypothetical protein [Rhodothermus marinus]